MSTSKRAPGRFGTFGGVFTPSVLTILGVIMFMRSGYVVGDVGIWRALLILALAKAITSLTTLSLSAIATNTEVGTGGNYFMISRTLGRDFGGAIGLTLFVSQAVAISFYVIGFSEALFGLLGPHLSMATIEAWRVPQVTSSVVVLALFGLTFKGAELALRAQYVILMVLLAAVASFMVGGIAGFDSDNFSANAGPIEGSVGFWVAFAIFFPAATGIEAGANMSGDLKDPAKSIPTGTIIAVVFTGIIYALQLILMAGFTDNASLVHDPFGSLQKMSVVGPLVIAGVFAGTLSSALGSFLGAPRILQSMGKDRLLKPLEFFGKGHGPADEPRRATVLSLFIALAVVWAGNLNAVAEVISMFFLIAYGMMNVSAFVEARSGNPSFRPRFRFFGWPTALAGAIGCLIAMVKIDATYAFVSIVVSAGIYLALRGGAAAEWGDAKRGYVFARTRENLLTLEKTSVDSKNWRPMLAVVTTDAERDRRTIELAATLEAQRGLLSILEIRESDAGPAERMAERLARTGELRKQLAARNIVAFADSFTVADAREGAAVVLQAYSIGGLRPNTIMACLPPPGQPERRAFLARVMACASAADLNVVLYKGAGAIAKRRIDVWWHGQHNGSLMAMFAYLASSHPEWRDCRVRLLRVVANGGEHMEAEQSLAELMNAARLAMDIDIVLSQRPVTELIIERSRNADVVMLGLAPRDLDDFEASLAQRDPLLSELPTVLLIRSNGEVDLLA